MSKVRVVIADEHACLRQALAHYLASEGDIEVIGEAADGEAALAEVYRLKPDVLLLEVSLPRISGIRVLRALVQGEPVPTRAVVLSMHGSKSDIQACVDAGAAGYVPKEASASVVGETIRAVAQGAQTIRLPPVHENRHVTATSSSAGGSQIGQLSDRELEVLTKLAYGYSSKEIAVHLQVARATVDTYRMRITQKLGVRRRGELVRAAVDAGLVKAS